MIKKLYNQLYKEYGKQGWWPLSKDNLYTKHHNGAPETEKDILEICLGAILTQNTNWNNVEKCIYNLNKEKLIDVKRLKKIKTEKLSQLIRSSGYYNQKAIKIKHFIDYIYNKKINVLRNSKRISGTQKFSKKIFDDLKKKKIEELRAELLTVKGIGPETADSIMLYAFEKPIFVIDAYTKRIFSRLGLCKEDVSYDELQKMFMEALPRDVKLFKEYHALLVAHGKRLK